jgi:thymidylate synthase (FAD)
MKCRHGSPFEHSSLTFFVHAPAFVWWEWTRHRIGFSYNLESSRYHKLEPVFWVPCPARPVCPADGFRSARPEFERAPAALNDILRTNLEESYRVAYRTYSGLIEAGIANEVARACLPFAVYFSGWVTCNPRSLMSFLSLRTHEPDAKFPSYPQRELEEAARACEAVLRKGWPITHEAFCRNGRVAP